MRIFSAIVASLLLLFGCAKTEGEKTTAYSSDLSSAYQSFEKARNGTINQIEHSVEKIVAFEGGVTEESNSAILQGVAAIWETEWKRAEKRYSDLEVRFREVKESGEGLFNYLESLNLRIADKKDQARVKQLNASARTQWEATLRESSSIMEKLRMTIQKGNDQHLMLLSAQLRANVGLKILELQNISASAKSLLLELKRLAIEGEKLALG
jgi:hypothetical protein